MKSPEVVISAESYCRLEQWLRFKPGDFPIKDASNVDQYVASIYHARNILGMPLPVPSPEIVHLK